MEIVMAKSIMNANNRIAERNRDRLAEAGVFTANMCGSPGAGKTALLEGLLPKLNGRLRTAVIEGDLATARDAERIEAAGTRSIQINTEGGCHLDAGMVAQALEAIGLDALDMVFVENVGNLVCTAGFALGEHLRIVVLSCTEGDDKVEKYPPMFRNADVVVLNKVDLLPHVRFDVSRVERELNQLKPGLPMLRVSATGGEGLDDLADWLVARRAAWKNSAVTS